MGLGICARCNSAVNMLSPEHSDRYAKCASCGASYGFTDRLLEDKEVRYTFDFKNYECIFKELFGISCRGITLGPNMYCLDHLTDDFFTKARSAIRGAEQKIDEATETLQLMKDSKKLWLINEMSGIDEQEDSVSDGSDGES